MPKLSFSFEYPFIFFVCVLLDHIQEYEEDFLICKYSIKIKLKHFLLSRSMKWIYLL